MSAPGLQYLMDLPPSARPNQPSFVDWLGDLDEVFREHALTINASKSGAATTPIDLLDFFCRGENLMVVKDIAYFRVSGDGTVRPRRIGYHGAGLGANFLGRVGEIDAVVVALAHLPAIGTEQSRGRGEQRLGLGKGLSVKTIKTTSHFTC